MMKNFGVLALTLFVAICASNVSAQSHNINWGSRQPRDTLLVREIFRKSSKIMQIVKGDYTFKSNKFITFVNVTDQNTKGKGGYATLLSNGPGYQDIKIQGKSQRGHGFNFIVEIYAV